MAETENSKDLISVLWSGADILRSKMDANEYVERTIKRNKRCYFSRMRSQRLDMGNWIIHEWSKKIGYESMERTKSAGIYINDGKRETVKERMIGNSVSWENYLHLLNTDLM